MEEKLISKIFLNRVSADIATGVIIGLAPNVMLAAVLELSGENTLVVTITQMAVIFQLATPPLIGTSIAVQFGFRPMQMLVVAGAAFVGPGVVRSNPDATTYIGAGTGDIINTMITISIAIGMILLTGGKFRSMAIVTTPIVVDTGAGLIDYYLYSYVTRITAAIGDLISTFTTLQPALMSILITCSFTFLIISPIFTVAIGMAVQLNGVSAGAAAMDIATTTVVLVVNSWKVNKPGVTLTTALGVMKMMMLNLFRKPTILVLCLFTAIISIVPVALFSVSETPVSASSGLVGLVGPLASSDAGLSIILLLISWLVIPIVAAFVGQILSEKILKSYGHKGAFEFLG